MSIAIRSNTNRVGISALLLFICSACEGASVDPGSSMLEALNCSWQVSAKFLEEPDSGSEENDVTSRYWRYVDRLDPRYIVHRISELEPLAFENAMNADAIKTASLNGMAVYWYSLGADAMIYEIYTPKEAITLVGFGEEDFADFSAPCWNLNELNWQSWTAPIPG